jgi:hypothetical protein
MAKSILGEVWKVNDDGGGDSISENNNAYDVETVAAILAAEKTDPVWILK